MGKARAAETKTTSLCTWVQCSTIAEHTRGSASFDIICAATNAVGIAVSVLLLPLPLSLSLHSIISINDDTGEL